MIPLLRVQKDWHIFFLSEFRTVQTLIYQQQIRSLENLQAFSENSESVSFEFPRY